MRKTSPSTKINPNKYTFSNNKYKGDFPEWKESLEKDQWFKFFYILSCTPTVGIIGYPLYLIFLAVRKILKLIRKRKNEQSSQNDEGDAEEKSQQNTLK